MSIDLTAGIVRILKPDGTTAGTGFVVTDDGLIATCAHVMKATGAGPGDTVRIVFHATGYEQEAKIEPEYWRSPEAEDVAALRLEGLLPEGVTPLPLGSSRDTSGHPFKTFGFPDVKGVEGMWGYGTIGDPTTEADRTVLQLTGATEVTSGFSGGPVLDTVTRRVAGMVTTITTPDRYGRLTETAFITSAEALKHACPDLELLEPVVVVEPDGFYTVGPKLDEARAQLDRAQSASHDFYNGTEPTWLNIAANHDARRDVQEALLQFVEEHAGYEGRIPVALITGRAGDGKSAALMRVAAELTEAGHIAFWHRPESDTLKGQPLGDLRSKRRIVVCIDDAPRLPVEEIEGFLRYLHRGSAPVLLLMTAREDLWFGMRPVMETVARVTEFPIHVLSDGEIGRILDKLAMANELGELGLLGREEQEARLRIAADRQLLVAMLEAKYNISFVDIVRRNIRDLEIKFGSRVAEACYLVSALHTFGIEFPSDMLSTMLQTSSLEADILSKTRGFLIAPLAGDYGLRTRHAVVATVVFGSDPGRYDRLRIFVDTSLHENRELSPRLFHAIRLQFTARDMHIEPVRTILESATHSPKTRKYILNTWALLEKELGNYEEARRLFDKATKADPKHAPSWQAWALMEKELGNYEEARHLFGEATRADPKHAPAWQPWAIMEKELGNSEEARRLFGEATRADPKHAPAWQPWALMEKELGNYQEARRLFGEATRADPKNAPAWQPWALMEKELGNSEEARRLFGEATRADPKHAPSWQAWALMEKELGNYQEACRLFGEATRADPKHAPSWQAWALMEKELGNYEEARHLFGKATKADPKHAPAWQPWALMEKELGNSEEARRLFGEATRADPKHAPSWQAWALMEKELGNYQEARRLFGEATRANPKNAPSWQAWALMEKELGNYEEARHLFGKATKADPKHAPAWQPWALMEKELGNSEEARRLFGEATRADPKHAPSWQAWAFMEKELGNYQEARRLFGEVTRADPENASWAWQPWAIMEKELGNYEEARRLFGKATRADPKRAAVWQPWALLELEQGNCDKALQLAQRAVDLAPRDFYPYMARGEVQRALGNHKQAKADFEQAKRILRYRLKRRPHDTRLLNLLGRVLTYLGDYGQAEIILRRSLKLSTVQRKHYAHNGLGELYEAQGIFSKAINEWHRALEYAPHDLIARNNLERVRQQISDSTGESSSSDRYASRDGIEWHAVSETPVSPNGYIKVFKADRSFGFISRMDGPDIFFHISDVANPDAIKIGAGVTFEVGHTAKGPRAIQVSVIQESPEPDTTDGTSVSSNGHIKAFKADHGFGFISRMDGPDIFFHISDVANPGDIKIGASVTFKVKDCRKGPRAIQVSVIQESKG